MTRLLRALTPRLFAAVSLAVALPIVAGCGGGKGDVTGKVTYNGQALPYGSVQFMSPAGAFPAEIKSDGTYSLSGVPTGVSKIAVVCQDAEGYEKYMKALSAAGRDPKAPRPKGSPDDYNKIPTKYADFEKSGLTYEVKSGSQKHDLELK